MRISDWSSDVCSSDLEWVVKQKQARKRQRDSDLRSIQRGKDEIESYPPALLVGQLYPEIRQGVDGARLRIDLQGFGISVHLSFHRVTRLPFVMRRRCRQNQGSLCAHNFQAPRDSAATLGSSRDPSERLQPR